MNTMERIEEEIVSEFAILDDPMYKYDYIIDLGKKLAPLPNQWKTDDNIVKGCQSTVWLHSEERDGRIYFEADSNTIITKGIIALLIRVLSAQPAGEIVAAPLTFIDRIGLRSHLSSQRSNGLNAMISKMKNDANNLSLHTK